jgi:hypothetical protein
MDELAPSGIGPYELPSAQSIRIDVGANRVTLVAKVLVQGRPEQVSIGMPMTANVADGLLSKLPQAIALARKAT